MIYLTINSKDNFLKNKVEELFYHENVTLYFVENTAPLNVNLISNDNGSIYFTSAFARSEEIKTPTNFQKINSILVKLLDNFFFKLEDFNYFPLRSEILNDRKSLILGDIQNKILSNLLFAKNGILKKNLYPIIWPNEKTYFVNKIDTHLTNLKNNLNDQLALKINFLSSDGLLKIIL